MRIRHWIMAVVGVAAISLASVSAASAITNGTFLTIPGGQSNHTECGVTFYFGNGNPSFSLSSPPSPNPQGLKAGEQYPGAICNFTSTLGARSGQRICTTTYGAWYYYPLGSGCSYAAPVFYGYTAGTYAEIKMKVGTSTTTYRITP